MIISWQNSDSSTANILARGNFSLGAGGMLATLTALASVTLLLAGLLALQGYWPILLIALIQLVLVSWVLVRAWERAWVSETIEICEDRIRVTHQRHKRKRHCELVTAWAVVELKRPEISWYAPKILLRSRSVTVELGAFLTSEEKRELAMQVQRAITKLSALTSAPIS